MATMTDDLQRSNSGGKNLKASIRRSLSACIARVKESPGPHSDYAQSRIDLLTKIEERLNQTKPRVFLSYPTRATAHADLLKKALEKYFDVEEYREQDFQDIVERVREKIRSCDFFVGIWHHEESGGSVATVSPWMPFEYGIALEAKKEAIVIFSDRLPEEIWKRIDPGRSQLRYSDLIFTTHTVEAVMRHCETEWLTGATVRASDGLLG